MQGQVPQPEIKLQLPAEDLEILRERKRRELLELKMNNERMIRDYEIEVQGHRINKKKVLRSLLVEDALIKETGSVTYGAFIHIPVRGVVGNIAMTDGLALTEGSAVWNYRVRKVDNRGVIVGSGGVNVYGATFDKNIAELKQRVWVAPEIDSITQRQEKGGSTLLPVALPPANITLPAVSIPQGGKQ